MVGLAHAMPSYWYAEPGRDVASRTASATPALELAGYVAVFAPAALAVARRRPLHAVAG